MIPRDDELDVAGQSLSPGLRSMIDRAGATVAFGQAATLLGELAGITLTTKRVERAAETDGATAEAALRADSERSSPDASPHCHRPSRRRTCSTLPWTAPGSR